MYDLEKLISITTYFRATHNWPEASEFAGEQVQFLENEHRHTFHVEAELSVNHNDRDVEFFVFQNQVDSVIRDLYTKGPLDFLYRIERRSCEQIACEIIDKLRETYEYTTNTISVKVSEDKEVAAKVVSRPQGSSDVHQNTNRDPSP